MNRTLDDIVVSGCIASALEVCGWPKPGNVHRTADFRDTRFEDFIIGSIVLGPSLRSAAQQGFDAGSKDSRVGDVKIGACIRSAVEDVSRWHSGGNTHLGTSMLLIPLAAASGYLLGRKEKIIATSLRASFERLIQASTVDDAVEVYKAVKEFSGLWIGSLRRDDGPPDISDSDAEVKLRSSGTTFFDVMSYSSQWDRIAYELVNGMEISFTVGYPTFLSTYRQCFELNTATVHTFLTILSRYPDTFIIRKLEADISRNIDESETALERAEQISDMATQILSIGGLRTEEGRKALFEMDRKLRSGGGLMNPGASADLTASSIMVALLCGFRP